MNHYSYTMNDSMTSDGFPIALMLIVFSVTLLMIVSM